MHSLLEVLPAASQLIARGHKVALLSEGYLDARGIEECALLGIDLLGASAEMDGTVPAPPMEARRAIRRLAARSALLRSCFEFARTVRRGIDLRKRAKAIVAKVRPDVLVTFNDRSGGIAEHLLCLAARAGVRTVLSPHEAINDGHPHMARSRRDHGYFVARLPWPERVAARIATAIGYKLVYEDVYWQKPSVFVAEALLGIASRDPWVRGGNHHLEHCTVAAAHYANLLVAGGVPERRISVVGYPRHDELAEAIRDRANLRDRLHSLHGVPVDAPLVAIGLPYVAQYFYAPRETLMDDLQFIVREIARVMPDAWTILSRHPRTVASDVAALACTAQSVLLHDFNTYQAMAISDLYLCSFSGTSYAALAAGCPLLSFDFYDTQTYGSFIGWSDDALHAFNRQQLSAHLTRLADPILRAQHRARVATTASRYGTLDGRCTARFVNVILGDEPRESSSIAGMTNAAPSCPTSHRPES